MFSCFFLFVFLFWDLQPFIPFSVTVLSLSVTFNRRFPPTTLKKTLDHPTNDPVAAQATLTITSKGASYSPIPTLTFQFIGRLFSISLINGGLWNEKRRMEIFN